MPSPRTRVEELLGEHLATAERTLGSLPDAVADLAADLVAAFEAGGKMLTFGNGGSAADAQHFAGELTGQFGVKRGPLPAIALTTDTSVITAIANDFDYGTVFERQVEGLCRPGDVVVGISTSGRAASVVRGVSAARARGARTWALTGGDGGPLHEAADRAIIVPSSTTARIQEMHITIIHIACVLIDDWVEGSRGG